MVAQQTWTISLGTVSAAAADWRRAYQRGTVAGIRVFRLGGTWWSTSASRPGLRHNLGRHGERCSCEAGRRGVLCHHRAMVAAAMVKAGQMVECATCGELLPRESAHIEYRHLGGVGEVETFYCPSGIGHRAGEVAHVAERQAA